MNYETLKDLLAALEQQSVTYAIFGAVALNLHGLARFTEDLDIFVAPEVANIERLKVALRSVVDDPEIDSITASDLLGRYPAVQYTPPDGTFRVDILTRLGDGFAFSDLEVERVPYRRVECERGDGANALPDEKGHRASERSGRRRAAEAAVQTGRGLTNAGQEVSVSRRDGGAALAISGRSVALSGDGRTVEPGQPDQIAAVFPRR